jgi:hypothetical protein
VAQAETGVAAKADQSRQSGNARRPRKKEDEE